MSWNALTVEDIATRLTETEMGALTTAATGAGQTKEALIAAAVDAVTAEVRGYVAACSRNVLGAEGTIPYELESSALALVRRYLFTRLPRMKSLYDELRQRETEDALQRLRDTAACRFAIVPPEEAGPQAGSGGVQLISSRQRIAGRKETSGL
jgi:phage gp36-like protein